MVPSIDSLLEDAASSTHGMNTHKKNTLLHGETRAMCLNRYGSRTRGGTRGGIRYRSMEIGIINRYKWQKRC